MTRVRKNVLRMGRLWMVEQAARGALWTLAVGGIAALGVLVLSRLVGLPLASLWVVVALVIVSLVAQAAVARARRPDETTLAKLLDDRTGSGDLFASALEFAGDPQRFGWLGELAVRRAMEQAERLRPQVRWTLGDPRQWKALGAAGAALLAVYVGLLAMGTGQRVEEEALAVPPAPVKPVVVARAEPPAAANVEPPPRAPVEPVELPEAPPEPPQPEQTVRITNEMIEQYLEQLPLEEVDLTGVTPIRWDEDEVSGSANQQNQPREEKIDPVKLDAALLKDLEQAKKTKDESGNKEGGVDVAVMGQDSGAQVKGKEGGKNPDGNLADAVSKDPRGEPRRMTARPPLKGFPVISAAQAPTQQKGEDRPMGVLDFLTAVERMKRQPTAPNTDGAVAQAGELEERVVRQESLPEDAASLADSYFAELRKADR